MIRQVTERIRTLMGVRYCQMVLPLNFTGLLSGDERHGKFYLYAVKEAYVMKNAISETNSETNVTTSNVSEEISMQSDQRLITSTIAYIILAATLMPL